jgi:hypothetical protein
VSHINSGPDALPSSRALLRSTVIAVLIAATLLVTVVLPAEYGVDPVGVGRVLGLTEMGRIKMELAREAAQADSLGSAVASTQDSPPAPTTAAVSASGWRDSMTVTLAPGKGIELKLTMRKDQKASYQWSATSPDVTYHLHGEPPNAQPGSAHTYDRGASAGEQGDFVAVFDGVHGWFWRNRSEGPVNITLKTRGDYQLLGEIK